MPPQLTTSSILHTIFFEPIDDRQRPKGRGLDQRTVDFRRRRVQCLANQQTGQTADRPARAIAVVPVECQQAARPGANCSASRVARRARHRRFVLGRCQMPHEPVEDIAHRGLSCFQAIHARESPIRERCHKVPEYPAAADPRARP